MTSQSGKKKIKTTALIITLLIITISAVTALWPERSLYKVLNYYLKVSGIEEKNLKSGPFDIRFYEGGNDNESTVILLHGLGTKALFTWFTIMPDLEEKYHILAPRMLYEDFENLDPGGYSLDQEVELVEHLMRKKNIKKADLAGISLGGWVAVLMALQNPERVQSLALAAAPGTEKSIEHLLDLVSEDEISPESLYEKMFYDPPPIPDFLLRKHSRRLLENKSRIKNIFEHMQQEPGPVNNLLSDLNIPALIIWGRNDRILPIKFGRELKEKIPQAQLKILNRCGHAIVWDRPEKLEEILLEFLEDAGPKKVGDTWRCLSEAIN